MLIRIFCPIDTSRLSNFALSHLQARLAAGERVLLLATGAFPMTLAGWQKHVGLTMTPMEGVFENVVCGQPRDWLRLHTPMAATNTLLALAPPAEQTIPGMVIQPSRRRGEPKKERVVGESSTVAEVAARYDRILVPTEEISQQWAELGLAATVIPMIG